MTRETKVGLLAGTALILLIGILVSDHLSVGPTQPADRMVDFAPTVATANQWKPTPGRPRRRDTGRTCSPSL